MRFNGPIETRQRIWFHSDDDVMDMWWKLRRDARRRGTTEKTKSKLAQNPLSEPFNRLICIVLSKVGLRAHRRSRGNMTHHPFLGSKLEMCETLIRWIFKSSSMKRIFNCLGNSDNHSGIIREAAIFIPDFQWIPLLNKRRNEVHCSSLTRNFKDSRLFNDNGEMEADLFKQIHNFRLHV